MRIHNFSFTTLSHLNIIYQEFQTIPSSLFLEEEKDVFNAVNSGALGKLKVLLEKREDKNPVIYIDNLGNGDTVLHLSAQWGKVDIIRWYKEDLHFQDINPLDSSGAYTPMLVAAQVGNLNVIKYIESVQGGYKVLIKILNNINSFAKKMSCTIFI